VNLRPVRTLPGVAYRLAGVDHVDMLVIRENVEGEYHRAASLGTTAAQLAMRSRRHKYQ
jgi:isocitrate/isopropylmalate dehydrogenase